MRWPKKLASWSVDKICKNPGKYTRPSSQKARAMVRRQDLPESWSVDKTKIAYFRSWEVDKIFVRRILHIFANHNDHKGFDSLDGHGIFTDFTYRTAGGLVAN